MNLTVKSRGLFMNRAFIKMELRYLISAKVYISSILSEVVDLKEKLLSELIELDKKLGELDHSDIVAYKNDKSIFDNNLEKKKQVQTMLKSLVVYDDIEKLKKIINPFLDIVNSLEENKMLDKLSEKLFTLKSVKSINNNITKYQDLLKREINIDKKIALSAMNYSKIEIIREKVLSI